ncbi:hypothetical protein [Acetobacter oeni]|uniref:Glycosyl transferase n=1 Tax=Acetobacter oeni TaxID=304077 RepID=A0A511XR95_9PROT|nr:hypothetical protein [Acetobacter oeni]MBB3885034.1 hypothetical protein [Acetobacter oeni]NHO20884.1 hypothetical protein [Acetobacter oeni]GEN65416.1 hypothetical protein AOE01nite_36400 [Acetobacter oeni]
MLASQLHVVTARSNPLRWQVPDAIYREWAEHILESGASLTVVECQYGDRPFVCHVPGVNHVGVRANTLVWEKERCLNIGIGNLPQDWQYVAWIDSDIFFRQKHWARETVEALQLFDVIQPWSDCYDLGPNGEHMQLHRSFCRMWMDGETIKQGPNAHRSPYRFAHPGYAWAATRRALTATGGLLDTAALGSADHHMALGLIGRVSESYPGNISHDYKRHCLRWQSRAMSTINGNIGALHGTIEHKFHGSKRDRAYESRWDILTRNDFQPDEDLIRNTWGAWELAGNKPKMRREIERYFRQRNEDANVV